MLATAWNEILMKVIKPLISTKQVHTCIQPQTTWRKCRYNLVNLWLIFICTIFEAAKLGSVLHQKQNMERISNSPAFCPDFSQFYVHSIRHHMQDMDDIIHRLFRAQNFLNVNKHRNLHKIQYTKNKLNKLFVQRGKFESDYIQNILHSMHTESSEYRPVSALYEYQGPSTVYRHGVSLRGS